MVFFSCGILHWMIGICMLCLFFTQFPHPLHGAITLTFYSPWVLFTFVNFEFVRSDVLWTACWFYCYKHPSIIEQLQIVKPTLKLFNKATCAIEGCQRSSNSRQRLLYHNGLEEQVIWITNINLHILSNIPNTQLSFCDFFYRDL